MPLLALAFRPSGSGLLLRQKSRGHRLVVHAQSSDRHVVSFKAAEEDLLDQVASNTTRSTSFHAYVTRRRPMGSKLTFLDLVSSDPDAREMQVLDLLHLPDFLFDVKMVYISGGYAVIIAVLISFL